MRVIVYHSYYGCDTGCCGHTVEMDGYPDSTEFSFNHPAPGQSVKEFVREMITDYFGEEHCADIDWDNCIVSGQ